MKKKGLIFLVCLALVSMLAVDGTFAQTVQGLFNDLTARLGELVGAPTTDVQKLDVQLITASEGILSPSHYEGEFAWDKVNSTVLHSTGVKNVEDESAYVRICIAVKELDVLHARLVSHEGFTLGAQKTVTIGGEKFTLYTFDYDGTLKTEDSTSEILMQVALAKEAGNDDIQQMGSDFIQVRSFAIQASVFTKKDTNGKDVPMTAEEALIEAMGQMASFNPFE